MMLRAAIVITTYNYARFLEGAIQSALSQRYAPTEVIVVDDGSTDETERILRSYERQVRVIRQPRGGQRAAYNAGIAHTQADVVLFLDADDMLLPEALERVMPLFTGAVAKVQFRLALIDSLGASLGGEIPRLMQDGDLSATVRAGRLCHSAPGSGNAYRVSTLRRLAPFPVCKRDRYGADFFAIHASALLGEVKNCSEVLGAYRVHASGQDGTRCFGNAASQQDELALTHTRHEQLRAWIAQRLGSEHKLERCQPGFSLEKHAFAKSVLDAPSYSAGLRSGLTHLIEQLGPAIRVHSERLTPRLGLCMWALGVALLPRAFGRPLARYGVDPASRSEPIQHIHASVRRAFLGAHLPD
jgi:hypothetical protein